MFARRISCLVGAVTVLAACGGDSPTDNDDDNEIPSGTHMIATIDGQAFDAVRTPGSINLLQITANGGRYILSGMELSTSGGLGRHLTFSLGNIAGPGTYPLGVDGVTVTGGFASVSQNGQWTTPFSGAAGSITVTSLTSARMTGTFTFTADAFSGGATGTKVVTNGSFNAPMGNSAIIQALADSIGSKMSATMGSAAWNGAIVSGLTNSTHLSLLANNNKYSLVIGLPKPTAGGTYVLSNAPGSSLRVNDATSASNSAPNCCYGIEGDVGSITITSVTTTRIKGTFNATLTARPGTTATGTLSITNGTFDIGLYHN